MHMPHLKAALAHNLVFAVQYMLRFPAQPLLYVALEVLNDTPATRLGWRGKA